MLRFQLAVTVALVFAILTNTTAAQSLDPPSGRDSLWNGTLIGLGAGVASAASLDAVFCENGFGGCDFPWAAYLTLGGIGAAAGAGIDFLIGRKPELRPITLRLSPIVGPGRRGVVASLTLRSGGSRTKATALKGRASGSGAGSTRHRVESDPAAFPTR